MGIKLAQPKLGSILVQRLHHKAGGSQPLESTLQPLESTLQPLESTLQPLESTLQPLESTLQK